MERDYIEDRYRLEQNGKEIKLFEKDEDGNDKIHNHFEPVFFANNVEELRDNPEAQQALRQFRIFVGPDDFLNDIKG